MQDNVISNQDLFERVAVHLLRQGDQSVTEFDLEQGGGCRYRGVGGKMCAVGCLIKDEFYIEGFEGLSVEQPEIQSAVMQSIGGSPNWKLLNELQCVHDSTHPHDWEGKLKDVAEQFGLDYRPVEGYLAAA